MDENPEMETSGVDNDELSDEDFDEEDSSDEGDSENERQQHNEWERKVVHLRKEVRKKNNSLNQLKASPY